MISIPPEDTGSSPQPSRKPRKKRIKKIVIISAGILLLLLILLLSLAPTIINSDSVRESIVDHINSSVLNGQLSIQDWSVSWTGGLQARGIELKDASNAHVLSIGQLTSGLSLFHALTGRYDLGDTELTGIDFNLRRDQNGHLNLADLIKQNPSSTGAAASPAAPAAPSQLPNITGQIHFNGRTCTYEDDVPATRILATFENLDGTIKIADINQPIETHLTIAAHVNGQPANLQLDGSVSAVANRLLDLDHLAATEIIALTTASNSANLQAAATIQRGGPLGILIPSINITQGQFDLHLLQEQHYLDVLLGNWLTKNSVRFNSGTITLAGKGKLDATGLSLDQPITLHVDPIELTAPDQNGGVQTAHLPQLDLQLTTAAGQTYFGNLTLGTAAAPLLSLTVTGNASGAAQLTKCDADLPTLQAAIDPILPLFASADNSDAVQQAADNVIAITAGKLSATGSGTYDGKTLTLSQPLAVALTNFTIQQGGVATPITAMNLQTSLAGTFSNSDIQNLKLSITTPGALTCDLSGGVTDLANQRTLSNVTIDLDYDLAKLWPLVRTFLSAQQQQNLADLQIAGKQKRTITLAGSFPAGKPLAASLASLEAYGYVTIDSLNTHGISATNIDLPFWLKSGVVSTLHQDQPDGKNTPKVAQCNGGILDLGDLSADLTQSPIRLSMPGIDPKHPHQVLKNVALTQQMAKTLFGSILNNPLFSSSDSSSNQGFVDLSLLQLKDVPLSNLITQPTAQNTGVAEVNYSIRQLAINGGLLADLGVSPNTPAEIDNADLLVQNGKITQDTTVTFSQTQSLRVVGGVDLASLAFDNMNMDIPHAFLAQHGIVNRDVLAYLADPIQVPIEGDATKPKIDLGKVVQSAAQQSVFGALLGGQPKPPATQPTQKQKQGQSQNQNQNQNQNPINDLLRGLTGQ
jgi:hypothetical protein